MKARVIVLGLLVYTVASLAFTWAFLKPAKPHIEIKGEPLLVIRDFEGEIFDVVITNTLFTAWVVMALLLAFWFFATRKKDLVPSGLQNLGEGIIELIDSFVTGIAGQKWGRTFLPLIATLFIYIAFANWLSLTPLFNAIGVFEPIEPHDPHFREHGIVYKQTGGLYLTGPGATEVHVHPPDVSACERLTGDARAHCIEDAREHAIEDARREYGLADNEHPGIIAPYLRGINTDLMTPASFAIVAVLFVEYWGVSALGFVGYASKFINFRSPIDFFVGILESVAEVARLISFSFRLFGNMLAGEILLLVMTFLVGVSSVILLAFYGLELFVGAIQAFVFGTLTLVFGVLAVSHHGPQEHGHEEEAEHH